jgi:subtilisin-like proprotein convertase family protein
MKMKQLSGIAAGLVLCAGLASAQNESNFTFAVNQAIPDANVNGLTLSTNLTGFGLDASIFNVNVSLDITNGFNGDYYAYLAGPDGGFAVLLNRVGLSNNASAFGYSTAGLNLTLSDSAANDIHYYQNFSYSTNGGGQLTGTWQTDGETVDPMSAATNFLTAGQTAMLASLEGTGANGTWTLFLADVSPGAQGTLVSWGLDITTVPEPRTSALLIAGVALLAGIRKFAWRKNVV